MVGSLVVWSFGEWGEVPNDTDGVALSGDNHMVVVVGFFRRLILSTIVVACRASVLIGCVWVSHTVSVSAFCFLLCNYRLMTNTSHDVQ